MSREQNLATPEALVDHDPAPDQGPGPAGFRGFFRPGPAT